MQKFRREYDESEIDLGKFDNYVRCLVEQNAAEKIPTQAENIVRAIYYESGAIFLRRGEKKMARTIELNILAPTYNRAKRIAEELEKKLLKD